MPNIKVTIDTKTIKEMEKRFRVAGKNTTPAIKRALKRAGDSTRTAMVRSLTKQTGLKRGVIVRALKKDTKSRGSLSYQIKSSGGDIALKHFGARETRKGVSAAPFGQRRIFDKTFMKGGAFPNRVVAPKLNGHVWLRMTGKRLQPAKGILRFLGFKGKTLKRDPIELQRSGVIIPREMVIKETKAAFDTTAKAEFEKRLAHEFGRII